MSTHSGSVWTDKRIPKDEAGTRTKQTCLRLAWGINYRRALGNLGYNRPARVPRNPLTKRSSCKSDWHQPHQTISLACKKFTRESHQDKASSTGSYLPSSTLLAEPPAIPNVEVEARRWRRQQPSASWSIFLSCILATAHINAPSDHLITCLATLQSELESASSGKNLHTPHLVFHQSRRPARESLCQHFACSPLIQTLFDSGVEHWKLSKCR